MSRQIFLAVSLGVALVLAGGAAGWAQEEQQPTGRITFTLRGGSTQDPAQAEAAAAAARQAGADAAKVEAETQEGQARDRAEQLNQQGLTQQNDPLTHFGVLGGPLSPTTPFGPRR